MTRMTSIEKPLSYHEQLHMTIKERIVTGHYEPGERLFEAQLAREFGVSRSPVREAMKTLEQEGLILFDPKKGLSVYKPSIKDVQDIYQCRQVLESLAVSLACEHASEEEIRTAHERVQIAQKVYEENREDSSVQLISLNSKFHDAIIIGSHNTRLHDQLEQMRALTFFYRRMNVEDRMRCREILDQHMEISRHLTNRDQEKAARAMHDHVGTDLRFLVKLLERDGEEAG